MNFWILNRRPDVWLDALIAAGCLFFAGYLLWSYGYLLQLVTSDKSYLSIIIIIIFILSTLNWLLRCRALGKIQKSLQQPALQFEDYLGLQESLLGQTSAESGPKQLSPEQIADHLLNRHAFGYFISDLLLKLGLVGTVIGFILMLGPISEIKSFEPTVMQQLLTAMSGGMAIALYTTLTGLVTSTVVKGQYHLADQSVVQIISVFERVKVSIEPSAPS
ncbi:MAG: MotA/TolQ/ExbB proton channel family protein [Pseudomonadales bacterium]